VQDIDHLLYTSNLKSEIVFSVNISADASYKNSSVHFKTWVCERWFIFRHLVWYWALFM